MNQKERLNKLTERLGNQKTFIDDGYYQVKRVDEKVEISFSIKDPCGASLYHPRMIVEKGKAISFYDNYSTPIVFILDDESFLEESLEKLLRKFEQAVER